MNKNTERSKILASQEKTLLKVEKEKQLLLGSAEQSASHEELKKAFGWNETDKVVNDKLRETLELEAAAKQAVDTSVFSREAIMDYCLSNNYVLTTISSYKGRISNEMLEAISEYCKKNDIRLGSDYHRNNFCILCPFSDLKGDNHNLKRSKRYKKGVMPKIIVLEKVMKGTQFQNDYFKVITEEGKITPVSNFIRKLYSTHTKQYNFFTAFLVFTLIPFLIIVGNLILSIFHDDNGVMSHPFSGEMYYLLYISLVVLAFKTILPIVGTHNDGYCLNSYNDHGYDNISTDSDDISDYITSYAYYHNNSYIFSKWRLRLINQMTFWFLILCSFTINRSLLEANKLYNLHKVGVVTDYVDHDKEYNYYVAYKSTGLFTYSSTDLKQERK